MQTNIYIPEELVNIIADYHDYDKYCKPKHQEIFNHVMNDIINMNAVMNPISPKIAKECWGPISQLMYNEYIWEEDNWLSSQYDTIDEWIDNQDDEENNYEMDYDDTHYYGMVGLYEDDI
tara:strand:+ start:1211 stop:1570 length:360 start_codon:yes stop_codon:yes gene_type:complete